jgi:hypothetical protein
LRWPILPTARTNAHWLSQRSVQHSRIVTTDEVLTEYLTFFSTAPESLRREAAEGVEEILASSVIRVIPQSPESFLADLNSIVPDPTRGTAWLTVSMQTMRKEGLNEVLTQRPAF